ncbi:formyltetrahydrofolate deformylase [Frankia sp. Cppng1_Ct_nod]|uniref:formyltetrahydrofolate deformylase n=1 Tax=Frankia sp. Cppng1_Ct_nod TaxID=2897162 RepID=UPI001041A90F|nr:formyltetrahydrofolate deformylase [Frankia sp. Cppng1_Ct_nod]
MSHQRLVLTLSCPDRRGIVAAVSAFVTDAGCNIVEAQQYLDPDTTHFFLRLAADVEEPHGSLDDLRDAFGAVAEMFSMDWQIWDAAIRPRILVMVSRHDHCLADLLSRRRAGTLPVDVVGVVSNHQDAEGLVRWHGVPFHHLPVSPQTRANQERQLLRLVTDKQVDLVVLARYMQVLSADVCKELEGRIINIHHSFLPSFKGARPYAQAHAHGVKIIGATAHYVTPDLDEGPIIEQDVARVDHACDVDRLVAVGRDIEAQVLARAVRWHAEHRVLLNGVRTVVFA